MIKIDDAYSRFCHLLTLAEDYFAIGNYTAAVKLAMLAARYAFPANAGLFASPRLERLLLELGKKIPILSDCTAQYYRAGKRNILHILTYARPIGGDSRFVWRWIQEDQNNRHSVAITTQADVDGMYNVPEDLRQATDNSGGFLRTLSVPTSKPLEQARELRELCQTMDLVILHLFPWDIIPILALSAGCDSVKIVLINHSDHTFWLGASVAHTVVHLRKQPPQFLMSRRGLRPEKLSILPIPLDYSSSTITKTEAKLALGFASDTVLLLTIASPFKYEAPGQIAFLDLVIPVLAKFPQTVLIAVGPDPIGSWLSASSQTDGRIISLGTQWDNDLLYAAADVYLDSVPFSSITSLLEAGSRGAALLGYNLPNRDLDLLGPGAPGLDDVMELASDPETYKSLLKSLILDTEFRHQRGQLIQAKILSLHTGNNWTDVVRNIYMNVEECNDRGCFLENNDIFNPSSLDLALVQLYSQQSFSFRKLITKCIGTLSYRLRLSITWSLYRIGFDLSFLNLLPPPTDTVISKLGRYVKSISR